MTRADEPLHRNLQRLFDAGMVEDPPSPRFEGELSLALRRRVARRRPDRVRQRRRLWIAGAAAAVLAGLALTLYLGRDVVCARWRSSPADAWALTASATLELERGIVETRWFPLTLDLPGGPTARLDSGSEVRVRSGGEWLRLELARGATTITSPAHGPELHVSAARLAAIPAEPSRGGRLRCEHDEEEGLIGVFSEMGEWEIHLGDRVFTLTEGHGLRFSRDWPITSAEEASAEEVERQEEEAPDAVPAPEVGVVFGRCVDATGRGLPNVEVQAIPVDDSPASPTSRTSVDGRFEVRMRSGRWRLIAGGASWGRVRSKVLAVGPGELGPLELTLEAARSISGSVEDSEGRRLTEATVRVEGLGETAERVPPAEVEVGPSGSFHLTGLAPGSYHLIAQHPGYVKGDVLGVEAGDSGVVITLSRLSSLSGSVQELHSGRPVPELRLTLEQIVTSYDRPEPLRRSFHSPDGQFHWPDVPPGSYRLWVETDGHPTWRSETLELRPSEPREIQVSLGTGGTIAGVVLGPDGNRVAGARLYSVTDRPPTWGSVHPDREEPWTTRSDQEGRFRLGPLSADRHVIRAHRGGVGTIQITDVEVRRGGESEIEIRLEPAGSLRVEVLDESGQPVAGRGFLVLRADAAWIGLEAQSATDEQGRFLAEDLLPGEYFLISSEEVESPTQSEVRIHRLTIRSGRETQLRIGGPTDLATLAGRVLDAEGRPQPRLTVIVVENELFKTGTTDAEGRYSIPEIPPGRYQVLVQRGFSLSMSSYASLTIEERDRTDFDIHLPTGRIEGRVLTAESDEPIGSASLLLYRPGNSADAYGGRAVTSSDGRFELGDLQPGTYMIVAIGASHGTEIVRGVEIEEGRESDPLTVRAPRGAPLEVRVLDSRTGEPVRSVFALLFLRDGPPLSDPTVVHMSDPDGLIRFTGCPLGPARLMLAREDYGERWVEVEIRADRTGPLEVSLER